MNIRTHRRLDPTLCGHPAAVGGAEAEVTLEITPAMAADDHGLAHGGFLFGAADHAAMLAVNHPNVVLAGADVRFLAPVAVGERVIARARRSEPESNAEESDPAVPKVDVKVEAWVGDRQVFVGTMRCVVPDRHVLAAEGAS